MNQTQLKQHRLAPADQIDRIFGAVARWSINRRWLIATISALALLGSLFLAGQLRFDSSLDTFFHKQDPAYIAYQDYLDTFVSDEVTYIMYRVADKEHGPFDLQAMKTIAALTEALEYEVPFAREATSLANVEFMTPLGDDDILVDELLIDFPESQQEMLEIKKRVMSKPMYLDYLISRDAQYAAIILQMKTNSTASLDKIMFDKELGAASNNVYPKVSDDKVREILARPEFSNAGIEYFITGDVPMNTTYTVMVTEDLVLITSLCLILIVITCLVMFRATFAGILGPITVVALSTLLTVSLLVLLNWPMTTFFTMLPTLLCAVGVAQSVHILLEYQRQLSLTGNRNESIIAALKKVGGPCLTAALTTAAGFAVMGVSQLRAVSEFGLYASFGIILTFVFSATILVIFLSGPSTEKDLAKKGSMAINPVVMPIIEAVIRLNNKYWKAILLVSATLFVFAFIGTTKVKVGFNFLTEFKPHVEWRAHTELVEDKMGGTLRMSYLIDTTQENGAKSVEVLQYMDAMQNHMEQDPLVRKTFSLANIVKDLNQTFNANNPAYFKVPDQADLLAQYLLVYQFSGGDELEEYVTLDFSKAVVEMQIDMTASADQLKALIAKIDRYVEQHPLPTIGNDQQTQITGEKTGIGLLWVKLADYISETQMTSYALVFTIIAVALCINFASIRVGLLCMVPNLTPVLMALGALGWAGVTLDYMKLFLATIAIGIAVDDTIHLVTRVRYRFLESGNYRIAMEKGLIDVGPALVVTSVILVVSFSSFLLSNTYMLSNFGLLLAGTITTALLADLFMMPVLLMKLKPFGPEFTPQSSQS